jgi:hypothetical protein
MQVRESADEMAAPAVNGLTTLLKELREAYPKRPDNKAVAHFCIGFDQHDRSQAEGIRRARRNSW